MSLNLLKKLQVSFLSFGSKKIIIIAFDFFSFSERTSCIFMTGGCRSRPEDYTVEILGRDIISKKCPSLPLEIVGSTMFLHDGNIFVCGGNRNENKCLQLSHGTWKDHSTLKKERVRHSSATTQIATFVFGGAQSPRTYEYLPKDSTTWFMGKTKIPSDFYDGCAIAVKSNQEILLIGAIGGGFVNRKRILSFNVYDHTFQVLPLQLNVERRSFACAFIPNTNKVMISGGYNINEDYLDSTEIIDPEDGSVAMASPMNFKRCGHGLGVITINGEDRLVAFGGSERHVDHDSVEVYNHQTNRWETTNIKLKGAKSDFGFLNLKLSDVISNL